MEKSSKLEELEEITFAALIFPLWTYRMFIIAAAILGLAISCGYVFFRSDEYTAEVTILPESGSSQTLLPSMLAGMVGFNGQEASELRFLPEVLKSHTLLSKLYKMKFPAEGFADSIHLFTLWNLENNKESERLIIQNLRKKVIDLKEDRNTGVMTISVTSKDPVFSAAFANTLTGKLNVFMVSQKKRKVSEQRMWIESRIEEVATDLEKKEQELKVFQERNKAVVESPGLSIQYQRILRDLNITKEIFIELNKQYEALKLQEIKETPSVQILDSALVPWNPNNPSAVKLTAFSSIGAAVIAMMASYLLFFIARNAKEIKAVIKSENSLGKKRS